MTEEIIPVFATKEEGIVYIPRPGAYAIIIFNNKIATDESKGKFFLPGGGLDENETSEDGLRRELKEELGVDINSFSFLGEAEEYVKAFDGYFLKQMSFYKVDVDIEKIIAQEENRSFLWASLEEFRKNARHPAQVWALETFIFKNS